ncbi:MAG TPA: heme-binding protein [Actinobacteria bacterium]|nr:heme-binding protein [Actinomycetota bacterium]
MSVESPAYQVVRSDGPFELRRYEQYLTASVTVDAGSYNGAAYKAFGVLADYIFGNNVAAGSIPMTTPVSTSRSEGTRIAMTAPVTSERARSEELTSAAPLCTVGCAGEYTVRFTMPSRYTDLADLPQPNDPRVRLDVVPAHEAVAERFGGRMDDEMVAASVERLRTWAADLGLTLDGEPEAAQYDAPWKPGFIRHNEVIIPVVEA